MAFAEDMAELKAAIKLPAVVEALGNSLSKVNTALHSINSDYQDKDSHVGANLKEIMQKKEKIRDLAGQVEELTDKVTDLTGKADTSQFQDELTSLRDFKKTTVATQARSFEDNFKAVVDHPNFDKAKKFLKLPAQGDDGKFVLKDDRYDFTAVSTEDMAANVSELSKLNDLDFFHVNGDTKNENKGDGSSRKKVDPSTAHDKMRESKTLKEALKYAED